MQVLTIEADVNNDEDVKRIVESTVQHFGQLDILVGIDFDFSSWEITVSIRVQ